MRTAMPNPGEGKRGEAGYLGYLLRQAAAAVRLRTERALADLSVTPPQFVVLTMAHSYPGASGADIARLALLTPQTVHGIILNLERAGLIVRNDHPEKGRVQIIAVTGDGETLLAQCRTRIAGVEQEMAAELSGAEEQVVRRWLARMAQFLQ